MLMLAEALRAATLRMIGDSKMNNSLIEKLSGDF